jgi:hypothetical protein
MLVPLALVACLDTEHPCDDDQVFAYGVCTPHGTEPTGAAGAAGAAGATGEGGEAGDDGNDEATGEFGRVCDDDVTHDDCADPAPYCAIQPGMKTGVCTVDGCIEDPDLCPEGWSCLDLGLFSAELPSICVED